MNKPCTLILSRHGESFGNISDDIGSLPVPNHEFELTPRGHKQVIWSAEYILKTYGPWQALYASTYRRSRQSAEHFRRGPGGHVVRIDSRLNEHFAGIFHALPKAVLTRDHAPEVAMREKFGWYHHRPTNGENVPNVELRIWSYANMLARKHSGEKVVVGGAHGTWMHIFMGLADGLSPEEVTALKQNVPIPNGAVSVYNLFEDNIEAVSVLKAWPPDADTTPRYA
jgi:broad specificity phosphatase PhoE